MIPNCEFQIHIYAKSFGKKTAFYVEQTKEKFFAGVVQGSEMEAVLTSLMAFFTLVGPENAFIYFHNDNSDLLRDLKDYENEQAHFINTIDSRPYKKAFKKYHELTRSFSFLMSYQEDKSKEPITDRLKFMVDRIIKREKERLPEK